MDGSRFLDRAWSLLDGEKRGYIYANDIPNLIGFISNELPSKLTTSSNDKVIESWISSDPMKRVTKEEFKQVFSMLVGTSFDAAIEMAKESEVFTPNRRGSGLFGSYRRSSNDSLPDTAEQLQSLKRELQEWKDKYGFLEREFQFFLAQEKKNAKVIDNTKHEFIIGELNRKLAEQDEAIRDLKQQLDYGLVAKPIKKWINAKFLITAFLHLLPKALFLFVIVVLGCYVIPLISLRKRPVAVPASPFLRQESWWERSSMLSRIQWYFKDRMENNIERNTSELMQNYNSVFGIS